MSCCDNNCNQGRGCPARVAKIGRKDYAREPLPPMGWREYLPDLACAMLLCIAVLMLSALFVMVLHA